MSDKNFEMVFRDPVPPEEGGYPGFNPRTEKARGMIIEYDTAVPIPTPIPSTRASTSSTPAAATIPISWYRSFPPIETLT